jgi:cobalt-precorrin 5A hydrolase
MIVAGVGFRASARADEIVALVGEALALAALPLDRLERLATVAALADAPAFRDAARALAVPAVGVPNSGLREAAPRVRTVSARAIKAYGVGSVAEAAALGGAGPEADLVLERIASAAVTCALALGRRTR